MLTYTHTARTGLLVVAAVTAFSLAVCSVTPASAQTKNSPVVTVGTVTVDPPATPGGNGNGHNGNGNGHNGTGSAEKITNVWADTDIRQALRDVAEQAGVTIVPDTTVQGIISVSLTDVTLDRALEILCKSGGFCYRKIEDAYYVVGLPDPANPNYAALVDVVRVNLRNMKAVEVAGQVSPYFAKYLTVDKTNNVLVITAPPDLAKQIQNSIATLDQKVPQVVIEALVAEISRNASTELDSQWRFGHIAGGVPISTSTGQPLQSSLGNSFGAGDPLSYSEIRAPDLLNLRALVSRGQARVRATPRATTLSGHSADIFVGNERYFTVLTGNVNFPSSQLQLVQAGISLKITPYVGTDGDILVELEPEVSDVTAVSANGAPEVATRRVKTLVRVKDGTMIALGGLTQIIHRQQRAKVPFLGDIPLVGLLFQRRTDADIESEVVIFIRPHILAEGEVDWRGPNAWMGVPSSFNEPIIPTVTNKPSATAPTGSPRPVRHGKDLR